MESLSNKTLAGLLVLAIVISLAGTLLSLEKFYRLEQEMVATGLVSVETGGYAGVYGKQQQEVAAGFVDSEKDE